MSNITTGESPATKCLNTLETGFLSMSESMEKGSGGPEKGVLGGLFEALANKHTKLDLNFQKVTVTLPNVRMSVELNGLVTLSAHMRDMTEEEKKALAAKNVDMATA